MGAESVSGSGYAGSTISRSSAIKRTRAETERQDRNGDDIWDRRSILEHGVFGVLFTLSKEKSETQIRIRWVLLKIFLDGWQLFISVVNPKAQGWSINAEGSTWTVINILNFTWLGKLGYSVYVAVLYSMLGLMAVNVALCVWVAWCFKEQKFPVVWPIKVLRVFSSVFFQAFDVASLNLLQLGISCRYTGPPPHLRFDLFPEYKCMASPQLEHAIVSACCLVLFVVIALLLNMAEVEVNPLCRRPLALGHSGSEVAAFAIKVLLTLVNVFLGWRTVAACVYLALSLALAWQSLRWNPHLVAWVNYLKSGVYVSIVWCCVVLMLLAFVKTGDRDKWADAMTVTMLAGLAPAFAVGALMSWAMLRRMTKVATEALGNPLGLSVREAFSQFDEPRDIEIAARCCRANKPPYVPEPEAVSRAHALIKAGLAMFPSSPYMVLVHANFMIDVLGITQSGGRRVEEARKLNPSIMCRFVMFVRQQQATQSAAGNTLDSQGAMDLLGYVEYQRKQRMVVRLHREALQAMCNFWKSLDAAKVSFRTLSNALSKIESSVSQAEVAYHVVLERYGNNPKLVHLYGRFLQTIKNDPWRAREYFAEAERLEEIQDGNAGGPLMPDGTPLARMDDMDMPVLLVNSTGTVQMANRLTHTVFGYRRGALEGKPLSTLLAPQFGRWLSGKLAALVALSTGGLGAANSGALEQQGLEAGTWDSSLSGREEVVVGLHSERLAFPIKLSMRQASGVGEDSTLIVLMELVPTVKGEGTLWVAPNGTITACGPQFLSMFGWKPGDINGASISALLSLAATDQEGQSGGAQAGSTATTGPRMIDRAASTMKRLMALAKTSPTADEMASRSLRALVYHKFLRKPLLCDVFMVQNDPLMADVSVLQVRIRLTSDPAQVMVVSRKGNIIHVSPELSTWLKDSAELSAYGSLAGGIGALRAGLRFPEDSGANLPPSYTAGGMTGYTLFDFLPAPWKDTHVKLLKDTTPVSPPAVCPWGCRKATAGEAGPTLALQSASGKEIFVRMSVETADSGSETVHVIRMARSSIDEALAERRVQFQLSADGRISEILHGNLAQLFGIDPTMVLGHGIWEVVEEANGGFSDHKEASSWMRGPGIVDILRDRALRLAVHSWRVRVGPPTDVDCSRSQAGKLALRGKLRASLNATAVMQVHLAEKSQPLVVDLWPLASVTGVLQLDANGRVVGILEEQLRPVGLLFGVPSRSLVGSNLGDLVAMPAGRTRPTDLLSTSRSGDKKSSLKPSHKDVVVKTGPVHTLPAAHSDGLPLSLDVQVVGKPRRGEPAVAVLRFHSVPLIPPTMAAAAAPVAIAVPMRPAAAAEALGGASRAAAVEFIRSEAVLRTEPTTDGPAPPAFDATRSEPVRLRESPTLLCTVSASNTAPATRTVAGGAAASAAAVEAVATVAPTPTAIPSGGIPLPSVVNSSGKTSMSSAAELAGRMKLGGLVKSMGAERVSGSLGASQEGERPGGPIGSQTPGDKEKSKLVLDRCLSPVASLPGSTMESHEVETWKAMATRPEALQKEVEDPSPQPVFVEDVSDDSSNVGHAAHKSARAGGGTEHVMKWVASQGAFYQNTLDNTAKAAEAPPEDAQSASSPDDASVSSDAGGGGTLDADAVKPGSGRKSIHARSKSATAAGAAHGAHTGGPNVDDGAASGGEGSDGGQSAFSAGHTVVSGAEYTRGKRYKKLVKLMDSPQAQQAQRRLRLHTLLTVAVLAVAHITCFVLTVTSIQSQVQSIVRLSESGRMQLYANMVTTDVRSLDIISANKSIPTLYSDADVDFLVGRISTISEDIKDIVTNILNKNVIFGQHSHVEELFFNEHMPVWDELNADGTDKFINLTIWDFATRFYTMCKNLQQDHSESVQSGLRFAETAPSRFLLKSGPDLWVVMRKILDALLYISVDNAKWIDKLQVAFLVVEGAGVSFLAACYLAYLLRAVAAQRYKLYGAFLVIPIGLTRALASQDTNIILEDEDEVEDGEEEYERAAKPAEPRASLSDDDTPDAAGGQPKIKRRATMKLTDTGTADGPQGLSYKERRMVSGGGGLDEPSRRGGGLSERQQTLTPETLGPEAGACFSWAWWKQCNFLRKARGVVLPLPQHVLSSGGVVSSGLTSSGPKRTLKRDSRETYVMLLPFVFWSIMVIIFYAVAVNDVNSVIEVVAVHSVVNFMSGRAYRAVFWGQELANVDDPSQLAYHREQLLVMVHKVRDAWYTLQLGENAYQAAGEAVERFPLVANGISHSSPELEQLFYGRGVCHRLPANLPCLPPSNRFYQVTHAGIDSMMQQFMISINSMATNTSMVPEGLTDDHFDYIYNVGAKDMVDGILEIANAHMHTIVRTYNGILVLHIVLFLLFWVLFIGFLLFLLNPLLKRISKERRRIAELMSQLPLELDVEKLVGRALGTAATPTAAGRAGAGMAPSLGAGGLQERTLSGDDTAYVGNSGRYNADAVADATNKWKAIIRAASSLGGKMPTGSVSVHRRNPSD